MNLASVHPTPGRNPLEERGVQPQHSNAEHDEDVDTNAPSSPRSVSSLDETAQLGQPAVSQPYLCSSSPLSSYPHLVVSAVSELRITDNSHSQSNPSQRKKGGCKLVQLSVQLSDSAEAYVVAAKCDVRKSFSNRSFAKYYNRGPFACVPVTPTGDVVVVVEEAKRGRDSKHFVAMERSFAPPWAQDDRRRHPLLAFAADAVYRVSVLSRPGAGQAEVDVKCQFAQGSATLSGRKVHAPAVAESRKRSNEALKQEVEDDSDMKNDEEEDSPAGDAGKRRRLAAAPIRCGSPLSAGYLSAVSSPASPFSTTDSHASSPSYPSSPFATSTASPSPPCSPLPFTFHLEPPSSTDSYLCDELELASVKTQAAAVAALSLTPFVASPLLAPMPLWPAYRLTSPGGLAFSPWRSGTWMAGEVDEFVL